MTRLRDTLKQAVTQVGAACSLPMPSSIDTALNYLWVGRWMRERGFHVQRRAESREQMFEDIADKISGREVLYLEFGVYGGTSIRYWSQLLRNPRSKLHGFDSFEGLPEAWGSIDKGHFDKGGSVPEIDDPRVSFFKGWFSDTLPKYKLPSHDILFVTLDADLYSSTKTVLDFIRPHVSPGTYFYFDEFHFRDHVRRVPAGDRLCFQCYRGRPWAEPRTVSVHLSKGQGGMSKLACQQKQCPDRRPCGAIASVECMGVGSGVPRCNRNAFKLGG
jgi:hypothetical protein